MTKKQFKEKSLYQNYIHRGGGVHAFYYDYTTDGYKWLVYCRKKILLPDGTMQSITKDELFNAFYQLVVNNIVLPYYYQYKFAETDEKRFKIKISI